MKKKYVITNTPTRIPLTGTLFYSFLLHYFDVSGVVWGIFITLAVIYWIAAIHVIYNQEKVDLNSDETEEKKTVVKSKFAEKLQQIINESKS